jgi:hypothetical protein
MTVIGDKEPVQVKVESVLHRGAVDLGDEAAGLGERRAIDAGALADVEQFARRAPRMRPAPAADMDAELAGARRQTALLARR